MKAKSFILFLAIAALFAPVFSACSNDDDSGLSGEEQIAHIQSYVLDANGNIKYDVTTSGIYLYPVDSESEAHSYCETILGDDWDGTSQRYTIAGDNGYITIQADPEDGVYISMAFAVTGVQNFTLKIVTQEYYDNENVRRIFY